MSGQVPWDLIPPELRAHIQGFLSREGMAAIEVSQADRDYWAVGHGPAQFEDTPISVTLTRHQWMAVAAGLRLAAGIGKPAISKIAHDEIFHQVTLALAARVMQEQTGELT